MADMRMAGKVWRRGKRGRNADTKRARGRHKPLRSKNPYSFQLSGEKSGRTLGISRQINVIAFIFKYFLRVETKLNEGWMRNPEARRMKAHLENEKVWKKYGAVMARRTMIASKAKFNKLQMEEL